MTVPGSRDKEAAKSGLVLRCGVRQSGTDQEGTEGISAVAALLIHGTTATCSRMLCAAVCFLNTDSNLHTGFFLLLCCFYLSVMVVISRCVLSSALPFGASAGPRVQMKIMLLGPPETRSSRNPVFWWLVVLFLVCFFFPLPMRLQPCCCYCLETFDRSSKGWGDVVPPSSPRFTCRGCCCDTGMI